MTITTPCTWIKDPKGIETEQGTQYMIKPGCRQTEGWGGWYYRQFAFCPFCGHPIDHSKDPL